MKSLRYSVAAFAAVCLVSAALAGDPSGTWKWTMSFGGGQRPPAGDGGAGAPPPPPPGGSGGGQRPGRESTLTLALKDGKVTGKLSTPGRDGAAMETDITDASFKDDAIAFSVERTGQDGTKRVTKYSGKLDGDTITGSTEGPGRDGQVMKRDWKAMRAK